MKIIEPSVRVWPFSPQDTMNRIELAGRTCYKSEEKITGESAVRFIHGIIKSGHESVLEHCSITVRFIVDRGVTHEIVRHRIGAYSQESTRYCNYGNVNEITVVRPFFFELGSLHYNAWEQACLHSETSYLLQVNTDGTPQEARSVLPNSLKTELVTTYNIREWRHFLRLRCSPKAHPQMQQVAIPLLYHFRIHLPGMFDDTPFNVQFPSESFAEIVVGY